MAGQATCWIIPTACDRPLVRIDGRGIAGRRFLCSLNLRRRLARLMECSNLIHGQLLRRRAVPAAGAFSLRGGIRPRRRGGLTPPTRLGARSASTSRQAGAIPPWTSHCDLAGREWLHWIVLALA